MRRRLRPPNRASRDRHQAVSDLIAARNRVAALEYQLHEAEAVYAGAIRHAHDYLGLKGLMTVTCMRGPELEQLLEFGGSGLRTETDLAVKGQLLVDQINAVRGARGLPAIGELYVLRGSAGYGTPLDAAEQATGLEIADGYLFRCDSHEVASEVADALDVTIDAGSCQVPLPPEIETFVIASAFELVFVAPDGRVRGWIDPDDRDLSLWQLHLMPGIPYPPGHEPSTAPDPA